MALEFLLKENVLTDDILVVAEKGKRFKGNFVAVLKMNHYLNPWQDKETIKKFRNKNRLDSFLRKKYPEVVDEYDFSGTCLEEAIN